MEYLFRPPCISVVLQRYGDGPNQIVDPSQTPLLKTAATSGQPSGWDIWSIEYNVSFLGKHEIEMSVDQLWVFHGFDDLICRQILHNGSSNVTNALQQVQGRNQSLPGMGQASCDVTFSFIVTISYGSRHSLDWITKVCRTTKMMRPEFLIKGHLQQILLSLAYNIQNRAY